MEQQEIIALERGQVALDYAVRLLVTRIRTTLTIYTGRCRGN